MTIGERIKYRRKELGLTVDEVAERLGKNRATIYRYESNDIEKLPTPILEPLATVLNTTPAYLMGWTEQKESTPTDSNGRSAIVEKINSLSDSQLDKLSGYLDALIDK